MLKEDFDNVHEAGKKAEYNEFWDNLNTSSPYRFAGTSWSKETFKPNKDITVGNYGFYYHNWQGTAYDLAAQLEELGVKLTMASSADTQTFYCAWFTRIPSCDFSKCSGAFDRVFYQATGTGLHTIDKIILPPEGKITSFSNPFQGCTKLANVTIEGVIDQSISFSPCPLTVASMKSIISCLKDYSGTENEGDYKLTFSSTCWDTLEADSTSPTGTTWREYVQNLGWTI